MAQASAARRGGWQDPYEVVDRVEADLVVARHHRRVRDGDAIELEDARKIPRAGGNRDRWRIVRVSDADVETERLIEMTGSSPAREEQSLPRGVHEVVAFEAYRYLPVSRREARLRHDRDEASVAGDIDVDGGRRVDSDAERLIVEERELRRSGAALHQREGERLVAFHAGRRRCEDRSERRREEQLGPVVGHGRARSDVAIGIACGFRTEAVVVRHGEDLAALPSDHDELAAEGRRAAEVVAILLHETPAPAEPPGSVENVEPTVTTAEVDVVVGVDRGRRADRLTCVELPPELPVRWIERVDRPVA